MARVLSILLFSLLLFSWLVDLNSATVLPWLAPDFVARTHANSAAVEEIQQTPIWEHIHQSSERESRLDVVDVGMEMLALSEEYEAWTFRSGAIRFVSTPVSPTSFGSLTDQTTWRNWFESVGTMVGVGKTMMIACFYFLIPFMMLEVWRLLTACREEGLTTKDLLVFWYGPSYVAVGTVAFPLVTYLATVADSVSSPVWRLIAVVLVGVVRFLAWGVSVLGAKLIGTLILILALPFSLLHSLVGWLISLPS